MAKSRSWQALSPAYRSRLERGGVTRKAYESGASVTSARGHAKTPERPARAERNPARYPEYVTAKHARAEREKTAQRLRRELQRLGNRYGIDDILSAVPPEERADYLAGWQIANAEYEAYGPSHNSYGRQRLDTLETDHPEFEKALGFYH